MSRYRNFNAVGADDELVDNDVEIKERLEKPQEESDSEDSDNSDANDNEDKKTPGADENQLSGMVLVVWALLIISVIIFVAGTIVKGRSSEGSTKTEYRDVASGMYPISSLTTEEKSWTDYMTVEKQIQCNGNTVAFYLVGEASNYGKIVYIPVTSDEFNTVNDGDTIEFVFSRLNIENKENILIRRWSRYAG